MVHEAMPDLLPVVVQDVDTGAVLMVAWTNAEARRRSEETGRAHFWSRSRGALWDKGATSGQVLRLVTVREDCDQDALLYQVRAPHGACHTGRASCFGDVETAVSMLGRLFHIQEERRNHPSADPSYTRCLAAGGIDRVLRKVGEEAAEFLVACKNQDPEEVRAEAADVLYHLWLALHLSHVSLAEVSQELARRHEQTGARP
ncbi:MAG: bifunctional phosphoribosyl-AMP cyclohydrolase/phosphoribosyl-ATP diphosphatase HisIE [Clostridia bacterium]